MVKVYYCNTSFLNDDEAFVSFLSLVPSSRKKEIEAYANRKDKNLSLACYLLLKDAMIREGHSSFSLVKDENGKPYLENSKYHISFSHSGNVAAIAVSFSPVGVDVELAKPRDFSIAERCFAKDELDYFHRSTNKLESFYGLWTLKESYLKFIGQGLVKPMPSFSCFDASFANMKTMVTSKIEGTYILSCLSEDYFDGFIEINYE